MFDELKVNKVLVIAPLRVSRDTWPDEVQKWDYLTEIEISVITGTVKRRTAAVNRNAFIYIVNRENVKWLVEYYEKNGLRWDFDMIVIDELSSFKNYQSQRFKWLRKVLSLQWTHHFPRCFQFHKDRLCRWKQNESVWQSVCGLTCQLVCHTACLTDRFDKLVLDNIFSQCLPPFQYSHQPDGYGV